MNRRDFGAVLALLFLPVLYLAGTTLTARTFFMRDLIYLFHPWRSLAGQMIQAGDFPLWNAFSMGGMPFLANCQSAILYPLSLPFWSAGFALALKFFHVLHYGLAGVGFYTLGRNLKMRPGPCLIASVVFAFNGYMLTRLEFLSVLGSLVWFPWIAVLALPKRRSDGGNWIAAGLGLSLTLSLLAGYPQVFLLGAAAAFLLSLTRRAAAAGQIRNVFIHWLKGGSLFLLCGAAQLLPTFELIRNSVRGKGVALKEAATYSLPVDSLFGLIYPLRILHHPDRFTGEKYFWIWSGWWGIAATTLVGAAFFMRKNRGWIFPAILGLIGIAWSMGDQLPFYQFLYDHFAPIRLFRYPPVALYWTIIGAALLALWAAQALSEEARLPENARKTSLACFAFVIALELMSYGKNILPTVPNDYYRAGFKAVRAAQSEPGAAMLSPKVNSVRRIPGGTVDEAMLRFRAFLFDQTNLPYRIRSIVPSGEPLALASYQKLYAQLESAGSLDLARPLLNLWNVRYFFSEDELDGSWERIETDGELKVYKNPEALGLAFGIAEKDVSALVPENVVRPDSVSAGNRRWSAHFSSPRDMSAVFNLPSYPGWKVYSRPDEAPAEIHEMKPFKVQDYFTGVAVSAGVGSIYLSYDPESIRWGMILSLLGVLFLLIRGYRSARHVKI